MSTVRLSRKAAYRLLSWLTMAGKIDTPVAEELRRAVQPRVKKKIRDGIPTKRERRAGKREETDEIRRFVLRRANGVCECCLSPATDFDTLELDHFFGRGRVAQSATNTWALKRLCHRAKTGNRPGANYWLERFATHCRRWGYAADKAKAEARLQFVETRTALGGGR